MNKPPKVAVLLAAGRGTRLRPHTDSVPKPLLKVGNRPTLEFVIEAAVNAGIERICLVTHYLEEQIINYVGDGSRWGIEAVCVTQPEMLGTAHALQCAINLRPDWFDAPFILSATDYLLPANFLSDLVNLYCENGAALAVSIKQIAPEEMIGRSTIQLKSQDPHVIAEISEKPTLDQITTPFSANLIFVLPVEIIAELQTLEKSPRGEFELQPAINTLIASGQRAIGLLQPTPSEWHPDLLSG